MEVKDVPISREIKLEEMETESLNVQIVSPFCISWSQDDKILIIAEGGVFIFELWPIPLLDEQTLSFRKSWIPASQAMPLSYAVVNDKSGDFLWGFRKKDVFETTIDSTLSQVLQRSTFIGNRSSVVISTAQIVDCKFSPLIKNQTYISCLTNHGLLEIYKNSCTNKWAPVMDITSLWISHCGSKSGLKEFDFNNFKSTMYELKIISMNWSDTPECMFLTGHENGGIVIWNVEVVDDVLKMTVRHSFLEKGKPCCLKMISLKDSQHCLLFAGKISGDVQCLSFDLNSEETNKKDFWLWKHDDMILPSSVKIKFVNEKIFILTVKQHILLIQTLSVDNSNNYSVDETTWRDFQSAIVSFDEYENDFIVCLQNHEIHLISFKDIKSIDIQIINTSIKEKHTNAHHSYGLTFSKNKAIWILASSPKLNYDSLKVVTHLIVYSPEIKIFKTVSDTTSSGLIEKILKEYGDTRLRDIFDLLELKKLDLLDSLAFRELYEINRECSLLELQLLLWEVKLKLSSNVEADSLISKLELAIAEKRAEKNIAYLSNLKSLSELEMNSFNVCQSLLNREKNKQELTSGICLICGSDSFFKDVRFSSCSNSHTFPRCCLSLLPCDEVPYMICRVCDSVALPSFVTENDCHCPYCDGLLEADSRLQVGS